MQVPPHDLFFDDVYRLSTQPLLGAATTRAEVDAFVALAAPAPGARVLDAGCGWGRHLPLLAGLGLRPVGMERARSYARDAARLGALPVLRADLRDLPLADGCMDAAVSFYSSLFFFDEAGNRAALAEIHRVLASGGRFVLQAGNPVHLRRLGSQTQTLELPGGVRVRETSHFDARMGRDEGHRTVTLADGRVLEGGYSIRHYAPGELEAMGGRAGFRLERVAGSLALEPYGRDSSEVVALFRKL